MNANIVEVVLCEETTLVQNSKRVDAKDARFSETPERKTHLFCSEEKKTAILFTRKKREEKRSKSVVLMHATAMNFAKREDDESARLVLYEII